MPAPSDFSPHVGASFRFGTAELRLTEVERHGSRDGSGDGGGQAFTLIFAGPRTPALPEGSYQTVLPGGPALTLYIMPVHTAAPGYQDCQAVFN